MKLIKYTLFFSAFFFLYGCFSINPTSQKSMEKYYTTFYLGERGTQYFIKPFLFFNKTNKETVLLDITFRVKDEMDGDATVNFTLSNKNKYQFVDSISLDNEIIHVTNIKPELLVKNIEKKKYNTRYTTRFTTENIKTLFNSESFTISIYKQDKISTFQNRVFSPNKKSLKIISYVKAAVFDSL